MTVSSPSSFSSAQAAESRSTGCLRRFLIPPLAVVLVSALLAFGLTRIDTAQAGSPNQPLQEAAPDRAGIAPLFTPEVQAWEESILAWGIAYQLDPNLIATVMQIESCGYAGAVSSSGALGLFQVMPYHFKAGEDPFQPETNAHRGLKYLRQAQEAGGSPRLALAGYNGGITAAGRSQESWPEETRRYVYWGLGIYKDARSGLGSSSRLEEWLASGGSTLCKLARQSQP